MGDSCHFEFWASYLDVVKVLAFIAAVLGTLVVLAMAIFAVGNFLIWAYERVCEWAGKWEGRRIWKDEIAVCNARLAESIEFAARLKPVEAVDFYGSIDARDEFIRRAQEAVKSNTAAIQG